ncbi:MAG: ATP-binding protein [Pseudomonadota bacterium]
MQALDVHLKRYLPKSLFGRALMILVLPILLLQVIVALVFIQRHYDGVTAQMAGSIARELNFAIRQVERAEDVPAARERLGEMSSPLDIEFGFAEGENVEPSAVRAVYDVTGGIIAETLKDDVHKVIALDLLSYPKHVDVRIGTARGVVRALIPRRRMNAANPHLLLVWMAASSVLLTGIAIVFLRNQVRPIRELAIAASAFGRGRTTGFNPSGADEVRRAGRAFLDMRTRIERHVDQRTMMLSGVSHDLKTPLTRMKLALAVADETPETAELARDVAEMEHMLSGFLAFAKGEGGEASAPASAVELAEEVAADARRRGGEVSVYAEIRTPEKPELDMRRSALKRALSNLVENGINYGGRVEIEVRLSRRMAEFVVEDTGVGIPEDKYEEVLRPFTRLDEARNQDAASGTGLGLSIALDIARSHGGELSLGKSERLGGLRASMTIPR